MSTLRPPDDEQIRVAADRSPPRRERPPTRRVDPTDAGLLPIALALLGAAGGAFASSALLGAAISGGIVGGAVGVVVGVVFIHKKYPNI